VAAERNGRSNSQACIVTLGDATDAAWGQDTSGTVARELRAYLLGAIASTLDNQGGVLTAEQFRQAVDDACAALKVRR
jgi:hypothetical protein